ncbi:Type I HSP40 co-chaperone [Tulasnella sp. 403]|nr:Type I HSP40 co-chaperone [Tulasnella sp. 403]
MPRFPLWHETEIDLLTALGGGSFAILYLGDRALIVNLLPGGVIKHGALRIVQGQGMPSSQHDEPGDLYVRINAAFPQHIEPSVIPLLEKALSPRRPLPQFGKTIRLEAVELLEPRARQRMATKPGIEDGGDEDDVSMEPPTQLRINQ